MITEINKYWILNLWEAVDGETVEINFDPSKYISLNMASEHDVDIIVSELLRPALSFYNDESKEKIKNSLLYATENLSEGDLLELLNFFGGTVFNSPSQEITCRDFYIIIGRKLFEHFSRKNLEFKEANNLANYRLS
jgi:hypothetical protein